MHLGYTIRMGSSLSIVPASLLLAGATGVLKAEGTAIDPAASLVVEQDGPTSRPAAEHQKEFDFWLGEWQVQNRHLQADGSWKDTSQARARVQSILGGRAILEEWTGSGTNPLRGFSVRAYNPGLGRWVVILNWTGGRASQFGRMEGVYDTDHISIFPPGAVESGQQQMERYTFSKATPESCQWDAARTTDGGENWREYWIMDFSRLGEAITTDATNARVLGTPEQPYCTGEEFRQLDGFLGVWRGTVRRSSSGKMIEGTVVMRGTSMMEGCGIQLFTDITWPDGHVDQLFEAVAFDPRVGTWVRCAVGGYRNLGLYTKETRFDPAERTWTISTSGAKQRSTRDVWSFPSADSLRCEGQSVDLDRNWGPTGFVMELVRDPEAVVDR